MSGQGGQPAPQPARPEPPRPGHRRRAIHHGGWLLHRFVVLAEVLAILVAIVLAVLSWRLAQGPLTIPWLAPRIERAVEASQPGVRLKIGRVALAWEGFSRGNGQPLDFRLDRAVATDANGRTVLAVPRARLTLSLPWLLLGRIVPRVVEIDGPRVFVARAADGAVTLDLTGGPPPPPAPVPIAGAKPVITTGALLARLWTRLARPLQSDRMAGRQGPAMLSQLRRLIVRDADLTVADAQLGATWRAPDSSIDLTRAAAGGVGGTAIIPLALGRVRADLDATLQQGPAGTRVEAHLTPVSPAAIALVAPRLAPLARLDAPISADLTLDLGPTLALRRADGTVHIAGGRMQLGRGTVSVVKGRLRIVATPGHLALRQGTLAFGLPGHEGNAPGPVLTAYAAVRVGAALDATVTVGLSAVRFADLPLFWPKQLAHDARRWVTANMTAGTAENGRITLALRAAKDLSSVTVEHVAGGVHGRNLTLYWLRPVPPITGAAADLAIDGPDRLTITSSAGHQGPLALSDGKMTITGLTKKDQQATVALRVRGNVADALTLLRNKRLHLLDHSPIPLDRSGGTVDARLTVSLPLINALAMEQVKIAAQAKLMHAALGGIVAGHGLRNGDLALKADQNGMTIVGNALLAGIPVRMNAAMDFQAGPPTQPVSHLTLTGTATGAALAAAGVQTGGVLEGPAAIRVGLIALRNGHTDVSLHADLRAARLVVAPLGWTKPAGVPAQASAKLVLQNGHVLRLDAMSAQGAGLSLTAQLGFAAGKPDLLRLNRIVLGRTNGSGTIRFPQTPGGDYRIVLSGPVIDLSGRFVHHPSGPATVPAPTPVRGPPWTLDAHFGQAVFSPPGAAGAVREMTGMSLQARSDGLRIASAQLSAGLPPGHAVQLAIAPIPGGRQLSATTNDAGSLLRAFDIIDTVEGGNLSITGQFNDRLAGDPLIGTANMGNFRVRDAPALGRLLQAMTLYGLVQLAQGPGLGFTTMIAPFQMVGNVLQLNGARAFSPSLGLTAKGQIDLAQRRFNLAGTIVPAYFFNSLLGRIPLIGRIFSPEKGGGLFAANYSLVGPMNNPSVSVNPLSALTPGFLRGVFGAQ